MTVKESGLARVKIASALREAERLKQECRVDALPKSIGEVARHCGVSRATLYRHEDLIEEWKNLIAEPVLAAKLAEEVDSLKLRNNALKEENSSLRVDLKAALTVIAEMSLERDGTASGEVVQLPPPGSRRGKI